MKMDPKKRMRRTLDFEYCAIGLLWFGGMGLFFGATAIGLAVAKTAESALAICSAFLLMFVIPISVYYIIRMVLLCKGAKDCILCTATCKEVHNPELSLWRACYFTLEVTKPDGTAFEIDTSAVFKHSELSNSFFGDYLNKPLQVLYNPKGEWVAVLKQE